MKKYMIVLLLVMISFNSYSQRMVNKQKAVELNAGILNTKTASENFYLNLTLNRFVRHGNYWIWGMELQRQKRDVRQWNVPIESYIGEAGYSKQLLSDRRKFITLNLALTAAAGYERVNKGDTLLLDGAKLLSRDQFVYGTGGRLSLETYLSDRIVFLIQGRVRVLWGTDLDRFRPSAGIGIRVNF